MAPRFLVVVCAAVGCGSAALNGPGDAGADGPSIVVPANVALPRDGKRLKAIWFDAWAAVYIDNCTLF